MPSNDRIFDESANNETVHLRVDDTFEVALQENPTTGFRWHLPDQLPPILTLLDQKFQASSTQPGAGGTHHWTFRATHPGVATIIMTYRRSFESRGTPREFHLNLHVEARQV